MTDDVFRVPLYRALRPFFEGLKVLAKSSAEVSGRALVNEFGFSPDKVTQLDYPAFNVLTDGAMAGGFGNRPFDLVLADMVIEHVDHPQLMIDNLRKMLRPGGWAVVTSVFFFPIHTDETGSEDYFRFTEAALRSLFLDLTGDWTDVHTGSWGNELAVYVALHWEHLNRSAAAMAAIREPNNPKYPLMTWAWARKAEA